ncbi:hypothetical protein HKBW3S06_01644, partial [Candidatus Hakubella thermalkaliphila]
RHLGEAVDKVRKSKNKALVKNGEDSLKGTKYLWLTNPKKWTEEQKGLFSRLERQGIKGRACIDAYGHIHMRNLQ